MLMILLFTIVGVLMIAWREESKGNPNAVCPYCHKKGLRVIYPDPDNDDQVYNAKCMRKRCKFCGGVTEVPVDFEKEGYFGRQVYKNSAKILNKIDKI